MGSARRPGPRRRWRRWRLRLAGGMAVPAAAGGGREHVPAARRLVGDDLGRCDLGGADRPLEEPARRWSCCI